MEKAHLKTHYSAKELLDLSLNCLPNSVQGILYQSKKNKWKGRKRSGQGGGIEFEFSALPIDIQAEIILKQAQAECLTQPSQKKNLNYLPDVVWKLWQTANER